MGEILRYLFLLLAAAVVWIEYGFAAAIALYAVLDTLDDLRDAMKAGGDRAG